MKFWEYSDAVTGGAEKHLPAFLQTKVGTAMASLRSYSADPVESKRVADFLQARAHKLGSRYLALVASRAQSDPFDKVKKAQTSSEKEMTCSRPPPL